MRTGPSATVTEEWGPSVLADPERLATIDAYQVVGSDPEHAFDEIVEVAKVICETPVALVSLVLETRQWFKATAGLDACETPIDQSVCAYVVAARSMIVIPDLATDPKTRDITLVTGAPGIRFYAGAPLIAPNGAVLGALCVIDHEPRPEGLTKAQAAALQALARQVVTQLDLRLTALERSAAVQKYRELVESLDSGFCVLEMQFDGDGRAVDYRFLEHNAAFITQTGMRDITEKSMREHIPEHEQHWFDVYGEVARTGKPIRFESSSGVLGRTFELYAFRVGTPGDNQVGVVFSDITEKTKIEAQARQVQDRLSIALDASGGIGTWEWDVIKDSVVSDAKFARMFGVNPEKARQGVPVAEFFSGVHPDDLPRVKALIDGALATGSQFEAQYRVSPSPGVFHWIEVQGRCVHDAQGRPVRFPGVAFDISARKAEEERREALIELGDGLPEAESVDAAVREVARLLCRTLGATRAGFATVDQAGGIVSLSGAYPPPDQPVRFAASHIGQTIERLTSGRPLTLDDIDRQVPSDMPAYARLEARAQIAVPLIKDRRLAGALFVQSSEARAWTPAEIDFAIRVADRTFSVILRIEARKQQEMLNHELGHRLKNTIAVIQAISAQTLRGIGDRPAVAAFNRRIGALAGAHDILLKNNWAAASINSVIATVMGRQTDESRFAARGPNILLGSKAVLSLSLILHELSTNATKYGSLSVPDGFVEMDWRVADANLEFEWTETGGRPPVAPEKAGFGSRLISMGLAGDGGAQIDYLPTGVRARFTAPLATVMDT